MSHQHRTLRLVLLLLLTPLAGAQQWPMFRGDASRSAYSPTELPQDLERVWSHAPQHAPAPAWPMLARMTFDRAHQVAVADGVLVFGSSVDGSVVALDARSGARRWTAYTEGPVRFAPAIHAGRVFIGSDDGHLHAFDLASGQLLWKRRGGPDGRRVLGNERVISRWPVRGGPVVKDDTVYFAAGIWPTDGIFVHALDALSGESLWVEDESGSIHMAQPHGGAVAESGVSAQGHLVATEEQLLVPTGRSVPAAFRRSDGRFEYYDLQKNSPRGGTATMASDKFFFNSGVFFDAKTGARKGAAGRAGDPIAGLPDGLVVGTRKGLSVLRWEPLADKPGERGLRSALEVPDARGARALIVCGDEAFVGLDRKILRVHLESGAVDTSLADLPGTVLGLAAAGGRLFASLDDGSILGFGIPTVSPPPLNVAVEAGHAEGAAEQAAAQRTAAAILNASGIRAGYCIDLEAGAGWLAQELARASELHVVALTSDPVLAAQARARLTAEGLYGTRVVVHLAGADDLRNYPPYLADLVVSSAALAGKSRALAGKSRALASARRLQRPCGGVLCKGTADAIEVERRGALPGSGSWTHQYADPANTVCSGDRVGTPLGMLWFREVEQRITQRHGRGPAPLVHDGRILSLGQNSIAAIDAYNGRVHWEVPVAGLLTAYEGNHLMGTAGTHGIACVGPGGLYVRRADQCLRFDPATGKSLKTITAPNNPDGSCGTWGFIATEGGLLFGSLADTAHVVTYRYQKGGDLAGMLTESRTFFAMDAESGKLLWRYDAEHSLRHNAIAIGEGRVLLIDRPAAEFDRTRGEKGEQPLGVLRALDARTGDLLWEEREGIYGTLLALSNANGALLMAYQPTRFRLTSEIGGRMSAFDAGSGRRLWDREASYSSRPMLNGQTIYTQGGAWDLMSGEPRDFPFSRSYGCGVLASGETLLVFRSATLGYCALDAADEVSNFGGLRPGCWINAIPAGGLVLVPDGSAGCSCSYQNKAWVALHDEDLQPPSITPAGGKFTRAVDLELACEPGAIVRYTLDGSWPTAESAICTGTLHLESSARVRAVSFSETGYPSRPVRFDFEIEEKAND